MLSSISTQFPLSSGQKAAEVSGSVAPHIQAGQASSWQEITAKSATKSAFGAENGIPKLPSLKETTVENEAYRQATEAAFEASIALSTAQTSLHSAQWRDRLTEQVAALEQTDPVAARVLSGKEAAGARKLLSSLQPNLISEDGQKAFWVDDLRYDVLADGTIAVSDPNTPTSEDQKQLWLSEFTKTLGRLETSTGGLPQDVFEQKLSEAQKAYDLAVENVPDLSASTEQTRIYDIRA